MIIHNISRASIFVKSFLPPDCLLIVGIGTFVITVFCHGLLLDGSIRFFSQRLQGSFAAVSQNISESPSGHPASPENP